MLRNALAALAGFVVTAALVYGVLPRRPSLVEERAAKALEAREYCEILFVGPSYVWSDIEPDAFDAEAKRMGLDVRSCKFGVSALKGYDLKLNLERLLAHEWPRLKLVIIDVTIGEGVAFPEENWFKPRVLGWHTASSLPWLLGMYSGDRRSWSTKAPLVWAHLQHVAAHYTRLGGGRELFEDMDVLERFARGVRKRGKAEAADAAEVVRDDKKQMTRAEHEEKLERLRAKKKARRKGKNSGSDAWPRELRDFVRSYNREAYFLYAPVLYARRPPASARRGRDRLVFLDFNDPDRYPQLYELDVRGYSHHLNAKGGPIYSAAIAREFARIRKAK